MDKDSKKSGIQDYVTDETSGTAKQESKKPDESTAQNELKQPKSSSAKDSGTKKFPTYEGL